MRDSYFDNVKLMLIILVVVGHVIIPLNSGQTFKPLFTLIYSFHMPLFIFISGYFSKNIKSETYKRKIFTNLIIPYFIFETLYSLFEYFFIANEAGQLRFSYFTPYWIMWFLFSMIIWKIVLPYVVKIKTNVALILALVVGVIVGYASDVAYYASLSRTIVFFPFFLAGYYFNKNCLQYFSNFKWRIASILIICLSFVLFYYYPNFIKFEFFYQSMPYKEFEMGEWSGGAYRLLSYTIAAILGMCTLVLIPQTHIPLITNLGKNTIYVYLLHGFVVKYLHTTNFYFHLGSSFDKLFVVLLGSFIAIILSTNIIRTMFKWLIAPKLDFIFKSNSELQMYMTENKSK